MHWNAEWRATSRRGTPRRRARVLRFAGPAQSRLICNRRVEVGGAGVRTDQSHRWSHLSTPYPHPHQRRARTAANQAPALGQLCAGQPTHPDCNWQTAASTISLVRQGCIVQSLPRITTTELFTSHSLRCCFRNATSALRVAATAAPQSLSASDTSRCQLRVAPYPAAPLELPSWAVLEP